MYGAADAGVAANAKTAKPASSAANLWRTIVALLI
jgi:hypothetical protein